jgi:hypothetical protein
MNGICNTMQDSHSWKAGSLLADEKILHIIWKSDINQHSELLGFRTLSIVRYSKN